jgi:Septum formation
MVAPAGVNEGIPQDPVTGGGAGVEVAEGLAAGAEPANTQAQPDGEVEAETAKTGAKPAGVIPAQAGPAPVESAEELAAAPDEKLAEAPGDADLADATPTQAEPAAGHAEESEPTDGSSADGGLAVGEHAEADADEPDWDAGEESRNVSPLAIMGIIVGLIALVGVAAGVLDVLTHGFRPKTVITYRPAAVFGLRPGECINSGANTLNFTMVSCAIRHDAEVFATFRLPGTVWPGTSAVQQDAGNGCASRLDGYLNPALATADLTQEFVYPNETAWKANEHTVICEVSGASGPLTGSVRAKR